MDIHAAVGRSTSRDAQEAGRDAARAALEGLSGKSAGIVLVTATTGYDQRQLLDGITSVTASIPLAGCSAEGVITQEGSDESSYCVCVMAIGGTGISFQTAVASDLSQDAARAGTQLTEQLRPHLDGGRVLLLFADGLAPNLTAMLRQIEAGIPRHVPIIGGTAGDLLEFKKTWQYHGADLLSDAAVAVLIGGDVTAALTVTHGCHLVGVEHQVTRADEMRVHEIDGRPAWQVLKDYLSPESVGLDALGVAHITLAELLPPEEASDAGDFLVRVPVHLDAASGALTFAAGMAKGATIHVALRDPELVGTRAVESARRLVHRHDGRTPLLVLQFDCAGRGRLLFGERVTQTLIDPVQRVLGKSVPWFGLHTYGEIAPIKQTTWFHNYTAVFCALYPAHP